MTQTPARSLFLSLITLSHFGWSGLGLSQVLVDGKKVHIGIAKSTKTSEVAYLEKHEATYSEAGVIEESLTTYYDAQKTKIATMTSDYRRNGKMPTYLFHDIVRDYREGLRFENGSYVIFTQEKGKAEKNEKISDIDNVFSCQGWHYYLVKNLDKLVSEGIKLKLILPSRLNAYKFAIDGAKVQGSRVEAILEINNWLFRFFAPKLRLVYDKDQGKLVEYEGISNILTADGERQDVLINYDYSRATL